MHSLKLLFQFCLLTTCLVIGVNAYADDLTGKNRDKDAMRNQLWELSKQPDQAKAAVARGKKLTQFCVFCHGKNGISKHAWEPNLAGQDATYLVDQLINFATGERKNLVMNDLTSKIIDAELIDIAMFFSAMENTYIPTNIDPELIIKGKAIYKKTCTGCHGNKGKGVAGFANLSGQKSEYIVNNLTKFQGDSRRSSSVMGPIVANLTDADIAALAEFIPTMNIKKDD